MENAENYGVLWKISHEFHGEKLNMLNIAAAIENTSLFVH